MKVTIKETVNRQQSIVLLQCPKSGMVALFSSYTNTLFGTLIYVPDPSNKVNKIGDTVKRDYFPVQYEGSVILEND